MASLDDLSSLSREKNLQNRESNSLNHLVFYPFRVGLLARNLVHVDLVLQETVSLAGFLGHVVHTETGLDYYQANVSLTTANASSMRNL